jgi:limonene-1,2-epoxide hydrolase
MNESTRNITRRTLFVVGAVGAVAAGSGLTRTAAAADKPPASDKKAAPDTAANIKLVKDFCASWNDPDKSVTYLTDDASVRMVEGQPAVVGPAAVAAAFKGFMGHGETISVKILSSYAKGPVVVNTRVDTLKTPGKPDQAFKVVGVFLIKDGKIKEWSDYLEA